MQACFIWFWMNNKLLHSLETGICPLMGHHSMASIFVHIHVSPSLQICFKLIDGVIGSIYQRSHVRRFQHFSIPNIFVTDRHLLETPRLMFATSSNHYEVFASCHLPPPPPFFPTIPPSFLTYLLNCHCFQLCQPWPYRDLTLILERSVIARPIFFARIKPTDGG